MSTLINFLFQSIACSLVFYGIYYWLLRNEPCHAFNRYYLLLSALFSLLFPLVKFTPPVFFGQEIVSVITLPELVMGETLPTNPGFFSQFSWLWIIYLGGFVLFISRLVLKFISIWELILSANKEPKNGYVLIPTNGKMPTFSFMQYLFWDDSQVLEDNEKQQILQHELAHIRKKHSLDLLLMEALHSVLWFNPLMSLTKAALTITHEYEADEKAAEGQQVEGYQKLLARQVLGHYGFSLGSHFSQSHTLKRLRMLTNKDNRVNWAKLVLPVIIFLVVFGVISCEQPGFDNDNVAPEDETSQTLEFQQDTSGEVYKEVDDRPEPADGLKSFYSYISKNLVYPAQARRMGIQGKVFVQFVVDTDGSITEVQAIKGIGAGCDTEAVKVVASAPKWRPGLLRGKAVKVRIILPITFKLDGEEQAFDRVEKPAADDQTISEMVVTAYR